ncbi:hypothetical protein EV426DRAFT_567391 [Tirmania nivea]|nr:hypothetical protein EV426DRAFT_567391 [Tirmania nivea]
MCIRITERYAVCQCVYYVHGVDQCGAAGRAGHSIQERTVLVGYACAAHTGRAMASNAPQISYYQPAQYTGGRLGVLPDYPGTGSSRGSSQGPQQCRY